MAEDLKVNSNTGILEFKRKFNLFVSNYDKGEFDGDFEITGDLTVDGDVEIKGELKGAETQIANAVEDYITEHPFAPSMLTGEDIEPDDISATGKITGAEIIENMNGYSFSKYDEPTNITREFVYSGIVKNGNKLTLAIAVNFTRTGSASGAIRFGYFTFPGSVASKIYPTSIGGQNYVALKELELWKDADIAPKKVKVVCTMSGANLIISSTDVDGFNELSENDKYYCRYELTLLLSDNLISNE